MSPRLHVLVATFFVIVSNIITYRKSNPVIQSINRSGKKRVAGLNFRAGLLIVIEPSQVPFREKSRTQFQNRTSVKRDADLKL